VQPAGGVNPGPVWRASTLARPRLMLAADLDRPAMRMAVARAAWSARDQQAILVVVYHVGHAASAAAITGAVGPWPR
jgi:hypothetical protein